MVEENTNSYAAAAETYRRMDAMGKLPHDVAEAEARVYDFLGTCSEDDFSRIADSGALNDIIRGYLYVALEWSSANEDTTLEVMELLTAVFDQYSAAEALDILRRSGNDDE
jgi:hypothetical protein